jgi:hypothetical protein
MGTTYLHAVAASAADVRHPVRRDTGTVNG